MNAIAPDWCLRYLKIPYVDGGRTRAGIDCYGLVKLVSAEQFGRAVPDYTYASSMDGIEVAALFAAHLDADWRRVAAPAPGDMVTLQILGRRWHCGVFVAPGLMVHAIDHAVSGIDRLDSVRWARRVLGYYRPFALGDERVAA